MKTIFEAKKQLVAHYWSEEGFIGVGIGRHKDSDVLRVYVEDPDFPIAQQLKSEATYEGFPVIVEVTGKVRALLA
jgi:hypothetical protein